MSHKSISPPLSPILVTRKLGEVEYKSIPQRTTRALAIYENEDVTLEVLSQGSKVPLSTLSRGRKKLKTDGEIGKEGRPSKLGTIKTKELENFAIQNIADGKEVTKQRLLDEANRLYHEQSWVPHDAPNLDSGWIQYHIDHSPVLQVHAPRIMEPDRIKMSTPKNMISWISLLKSVLQLHNILPSLLWNFDESSLRIDSSKKSPLIYFREDIPPPSKSSNRVENATICCAVAADGTSLPSILLWPTANSVVEFRSLPSFNISPLYRNTGWINTETYREIMINHLFPSIDKKRKDLKLTRNFALILLDGHQTRKDEEVLRQARLQRILLLRFPPHTTHLCQPLDRFVFARFKKELYSNFVQPETSGIMAYRQELARVLPLALGDALHPKTIQASFRQAGVWPTSEEPLLIALQKICKKQGVTVQEQLGKTRLSIEDMQEMATTENQTASGELLTPSEIISAPIMSKQTTLDAFLQRRPQRNPAIPASVHEKTDLLIRPCKREESTPDSRIPVEKKTFCRMIRDDDDEE